MYDAGGISLKPSDAVHAQMKNDMSGAAAVLASMCALRDLACTTAVTGYLMCTDNMPSGTATALGDVITYRNGTTVEMLDTDAEGRVVMADALILAVEEGHDAAVDIATLTGSAMRALGTDMSALFGNHPGMIDQVRAAASVSGELVWQLPLHQPYKRDLDSLTADLMNCAAVGKPDAIIAALFLAHFAGDLPWAHVDMAGPAQAGSASGLLVPGCSGWGARLLAHVALSFTPPDR
jgi:leucyl aminopeptidase